MVYSDGSDDGPLMFERCNSIPEKGNRVAVVMRARGGRVASVTSRLTLSICPFFNLPISSPLVTDRIFFLPADIIGVRRPQKWESRCDRWGKRSDQRWGERKSNFESLTSLPPNFARIRLAEVVWVTRSILVVARHVFKWNCQFWRSCLEAAASDQVCCRRRFLKCVTRPAASQGTVICHYHNCSQPQFHHQRSSYLEIDNFNEITKNIIPNNTVYDHIVYDNVLSSQMH